jgi:NTP pyrophosphatase (non-canonical NTP hydrolase)
MKDPTEYIRNTLSREELLTQLAEECAELSKAALKLRRAYNGYNPTPMTRADAYNNLIEEIADVTLCVEVLGFNSPENLHNIGQIWEEKLFRWAKRLDAKKKPQKAIYTGYSNCDCCGYYRCPVCGNTFCDYSNDYSQKRCSSCGTELEF